MAEGTRLLSERGSQARRGFESRPLRKKDAPSGEEENLDASTKLRELGPHQVFFICPPGKGKAPGPLAPQNGHA